MSDSTERARHVSASCRGERCSMCGAPAAAKVGEEIPHDDPHPYRHNLTAYVCAAHFDQIMDRSGYLRAPSPDTRLREALQRIFELGPDARLRDARNIARDALASHTTVRG
jgi:hypothetical protein